MVPSAPGIDYPTAPADSPCALDANAPSIRAACLGAPSACVTAATAPAMRTAADADAPPKPVELIICDCASGTRIRRPLVGRTSASAQFWPRAASVRARAVGGWSLSLSSTRAHVGFLPCSGHDHFSADLPSVIWSTLSASRSTASQTFHAVEHREHQH